MCPADDGCCCCCRGGEGLAGTGAGAALGAVMPSPGSITSMVGLTMLAHREGLPPLFVGPAAKQAPLQRPLAVSSLLGHCRPPVVASTTQCNHILGVCTPSQSRMEVRLWMARLLSTSLTTQGCTHALPFSSLIRRCGATHRASSTCPHCQPDICQLKESIFQAGKRSTQAGRRDSQLVGQSVRRLDFCVGRQGQGSQHQRPTGGCPWAQPGVRPPRLPLRPPGELQGVHGRPELQAHF